MSAMTDREKVEFLRGWLGIGHTDGTPFEAAGVKLYFREEACGYITMKELVELVEYYNKLSFMLELGYVMTPADKFTYWMLKENQVIDAFGYLADELNKPTHPVLSPE